MSKAVPAQIVLETEHAVAFRDLHPAAPVHILVVPRSHVAGARDADQDTFGQVLFAAREAAAKAGLDASGYRLVINQGHDAGQSLFHLHVHVLGGRALSWPPG